MEYPKLPPEKNRRRKLTPQDIEQVRWLVKEGMSRKEVARQFGVSLTTIDFWCWSEEQRKRHYERNKKGTKERGAYDNPATRAKRQKGHRAYKKAVYGAEAIRRFKYEQQKHSYTQKSARIRQRRLKRAAELLKQHGKEWMGKRYGHLPQFLQKVYTHQPSLTRNSDEREERQEKR